MADDTLPISSLDTATSVSSTDKLLIERSSGDLAITVDLLTSIERTRALNAEQNNAESLAEEVSRATAAETALQLNLKSISIPVASVVANTDAVKSDFPYCYDYSLADITANSWADIFPASLSDSSVVDACLEGHNLTGAGTIRIYFFAVPSAVANVVIVYQKGVTA